MHAPTTRTRWPLLNTRTNHHQANGMSHSIRNERNPPRKTNGEAKTLNFISHPVYLHVTQTFPPYTSDHTQKVLTPPQPFLPNSKVTLATSTLQFPGHKMKASSPLPASSCALPIGSSAYTTLTSHMVVAFIPIRTPPPLLPFSHLPISLTFSSSRRRSVMMCSVVALAAARSMYEP